MARLDVYEWGPGTLVVDVQSALLRELRTRVVAPLVPGERLYGPIRDLNPVVIIGGVAHVMMTESLAAVPSKSLGQKIASLHDWHDEITRALDILLLGA